MKHTILFLLTLLVVTASAFAQEYALSIRNEAQTTGNTYEFDVYLQKTGATWVDYSWGQFVITFNTAIVRPGGVLYFTFVPGSSQLTTASQIPVQGKLSISGNELRVAAGTPPGSGSGSMISLVSPGTRILRFRIVSTTLAGGLGTPVSFAAVAPNIAWKSASPNPYTQIAGYVTGVSTTLPQGTFTGPLTNAPLPVELTTFRARLNGKAVDLAWRTATESNNAGFEVQRRTGAGENDWQDLGFVQGAGSSSTPRDYTYTDMQIPSSGDAYYRLKQIDRDGKFDYSSVVSVKIGSSASFALFPNYPNPFRGTTTIAFTLPQDAQTSVKVYDLNGKLMKTIAEEYMKSGYNSMTMDAAGMMPGTYKYIVQSGPVLKAGTMTVAR